ncbi:MAG: hypothetical protein JWM33_1761 [Caulobacteraceae bacterium]|nr:hypothetical protein [Caulobacteraceae bacterium]
MTAPPILRKLPSWSYLPLGILPILLLAAVARLHPAALHGLAPFHGLLPLLTIWACACSLGWWFTLDEVSQQAHKISWFWGASAGLMIALFAAIAAALLSPGLIEALVGQLTLPLRPDSGWRPEPLAFVFGVMFAAIAQLAAYSVFWLGWWAVRRAPK